MYLDRTNFEYTGYIIPINLFFLAEVFFVFMCN